MDSRGLERELRKLPGVVACAITAEAVSVLLSESADAAMVAKEAAVLASSFGAPPVRVLGPTGAAKAPVRSIRPRVAAGTAVAAAIALIATLVPIGKKVAPRVASPAALRPAPADDGNVVLPPIVVPQRPARQQQPAVIEAAGGRAPSSAPRIAVPAPGARVLPRTVAKPVQPVEPAGCEPNGKAIGRVNHEGDGNQSHRRHHTHASGHAEHWFDCT